MQNDNSYAKRAEHIYTTLVDLECTQNVYETADAQGASYQTVKNWLSAYGELVYDSNLKQEQALLKIEEKLKRGRIMPLGSRAKYRLLKQIVGEDGKSAHERIFNLLRDSDIGEKRLRHQILCPSVHEQLKKGKASRNTILKIANALYTTPEFILYGATSNMSNEQEKTATESSALTELDALEQQIQNATFGKGPDSGHANQIAALQEEVKELKRAQGRLVDMMLTIMKKV